ncbi:MAG: phosphoribosylformylglycinamidine synthase subunit PurQ, partial [Clostridia bacterium]
SLANDLNICSKQGLAERFDSTIGAGTILMPYGGKYQITPIQAMANKISTEKGDSDTCSVLSWGYNPFISELSPYHGAYLAVIESVSKLIATGASFDQVYLTFQEYFAKPNKMPERFGQPFEALLGAFKAQKDLGIAAIGGKDSMSGTFEDIDVPPTLVSFAITPEKIVNIKGNEFKQVGNNVYLLKAKYDSNNLPQAKSYKELLNRVTSLLRSGKVVSCYTPTIGGVAEAIMKMSFGNKLGFHYDSKIDLETIFGYNYGAFIIETSEEIDDALYLGKVAKGEITYKDNTLVLETLLKDYQEKLEPIFPTKAAHDRKEIENISYQTSKFGNSKFKIPQPKVLIPVFPGTNCEYDSAKAIEKAGGKADIFVINNLSTSGIQQSVDEFAKRIKNSQMIFIPGGFSGGDEPDGSGKFITAFLRNQKIMDSINELIKNKDGLMCGICNGFQALIKLGLVPYGEITQINEDSPTLTFNTIARHQSRIVRIRVASNKSPWLCNCNVGDIVNVPISHGEGRFVANDKWLSKLISNGQVATQYVDFNGKATYDIEFNPNNSVMAIEGITSPDGRILGKMGHSERIGNGLYKNIEGNFDMKLFESAVKYFR